MTSGPVDGFINKYINIYLYIYIYIQVYLYLPTCVIGGLSELKPENCPLGGEGNGQQGGRGVCELSPSPGHESTSVTLGYFYRRLTRSRQVSYGGGGPEYPRVTNKVFPALSHGWWSIILKKGKKLSPSQGHESTSVTPERS